MKSTRQIALIGFLICFGVVAMGLILEYWKNLESCLLCDTQRIIFIIIGLSFLFTLTKKIKTKIIGFVTSFFCILGMLVSGWQVYLQHNPSEDNGLCLPSLSFLWQTGTVSDVFHAIIHGNSGECAQIVWQFLGLSMAVWAFIFFAGLFFLSLFLFKPKLSV